MINSWDPMSCMYLGVYCTLTILIGRYLVDCEGISESYLQWSTPLYQGLHMAMDVRCGVSGNSLIAAGGYLDHRFLRLPSSVRTVFSHFHF